MQEHGIWKGSGVDGAARTTSAKPSVNLFVGLILRYVQEGRRELAASAIRGGVGPKEREELLARLASMEGDAAEAARAALSGEAVLLSRINPSAGAPDR